MGLYRILGRPILFLLPPETAHRAAALALRSPLPWDAIAGTVPRIPAEFAGIRASTPIGLAAGFDKNATMVDGLSRLGFGYIVVGTVSRHPRAGNPKPRIRRVAAQAALVNAMGIPNDGVDAVAARLASRSGTAPIIASVADEDPDDVATVVERLEPHVAAIELNVSSPNSPWRHSGRDNSAHLREVLEMLSGRGKPLFVKLPPFDPSDGEAASLVLARIAMEAGVEGLTCANTRPVADAAMPHGRGGLSGAPLAGATPGMIAALRSLAPEPMAINACGGIADGHTARRCLDAGADTVQLYTGLIYEGPRVVRGIASELARTASVGEDDH